MNVLTPTLQHYLIVSGLLFCLGLFCVLARRNLLVIYMSLELMLNAANLALVSFSHFNNQLNRKSKQLRVPNPNRNKETRM